MSLNRCIAPVAIGASGAEGLVAAHLILSLDNSTLIAPMPLSDPSVKPVLLSFPYLAQHCTSNFTDAHSSVYRMLASLTGAGSLVKPVQLSLDPFVPLSIFSLCFGVSMVVWTWRFDGGLDLVPRR